MKIYTKNAPEPIGPYSQGISVNGFTFFSGQIAINPQTGEFAAGNIEEQTELICKNIAALLAAADMDFKSVIKTTCFLADMNDFPIFNTIYAKYFTSNPARSCVAVRELPKGALAEIEVIAAKSI